MVRNERRAFCAVETTRIMTGRSAAGALERRNKETVETTGIMTGRGVVGALES